MKSKHYIIDLTTTSYSVPLKTTKTKLEVIVPTDIEGDTFLMKTTSLGQIFHKGLAKILLGITMDLILIFWKEQTKSFQKIYTFALLWCTVFELWLVVLRYIATPQNHLYSPSTHYFSPNQIDLRSLKHRIISKK